MRRATFIAILVCSFVFVSCAKQDTASTPMPSPAPASPSATVATSAAPPNFTVCDGTYALCTSAKCSSGTGQPANAVTCRCEVKKGYSVGSKPCTEVSQSSPEAGQAIHSRYFPIKSTAVCLNAEQWAFCLDSPCTVDKDTSKANCTCTLKTTPNQGYVVVAATKDDAMCTGTIWSSATVHDVIGVTAFLYSQNPQLLPPSQINIVRVDASQ